MTVNPKTIKAGLDRVKREQAAGRAQTRAEISKILREEFAKGAAGAPIVEQEPLRLRVKLQPWQQKLLDDVARMNLIDPADVQEFVPYIDDEVYDPTTQQPVEREGFVRIPIRHDEPVFDPNWIENNGVNLSKLYPDAIDIVEITHKPERDA